jgi:hypothetical protein
MKNAHKVVIGEKELKRTLTTTRRELDDNIKMHIEEMGCEMRDD